MSERKWRRRSEAEWRSLIERFGSSGLSIEAFCRSESISAASFYRWRQRSEDALSGTEPGAPRFLDRGAVGGGERWELEFDLGGGRVLRFRGG
jgi:transposase-like protein